VADIDSLNIPTSDAVHGIPRSHYGAHLLNFDFRGDRDLKRLACRFLDGERFWLYLHGRTGTGKTHFAVGLHRAIVASLGFEGADSSSFTTWSDLVYDVRRSFDRKNYEQVVDAYLECDALIIDDLTGHMQDFQSRLVEEIVRRRHANDRRLVITSNEPYERFLGLFGEHEVSRIRSVCVAAQFVGPDGRLS
jgi:DNA replication protein DnaC